MSNRSRRGEKEGVMTPNLLTFLMRPWTEATPIQPGGSPAAVAASGGRIRKAADWEETQPAVHWECLHGSVPGAIGATPAVAEEALDRHERISRRGALAGLALLSSLLRDSGLVQGDQPCTELERRLCRAAGSEIGYGRLGDAAVVGDLALRHTRRL